jgi:thiol-disulfide isomerase/thioredoxin
MKKTTAKSTTRREILKKGSYVVPAVLTLAVQPSFATAASGSGGGSSGGDTGSRPGTGVYGEKPKPKAMMVIIAAGWCGPCQQEAKNVLPGEHAEFAPKAEFITIMAEDAGYNEPNLKDIENWATKYKATWPSVVDGQFKFFALAAEPAFPANILIDTRTMTIVDRVAGADPAIFQKMADLLAQ